MGVVYVFNASLLKINLSINSQPGATIWPASKTSKPPYRPPGAQVARSNVSPAPGLFINGQVNSVAVQNTGRGQSDPVSLNVPAASASTDDLWLYVYADLMILFDTQGKSLDQEWIDWGGATHDGPASAVGAPLIDRGPQPPGADGGRRRAGGERRSSMSG